MLIEVSFEEHNIKRFDFDLVWNRFIFYPAKSKLLCYFTTKIKYYIDLMPRSSPSKCLCRCLQAVARAIAIIIVS